MVSNPEAGAAATNPRATARTLGLLLLLTLGITLPFVNQAFHIDDPTFIAIAHQLARDPWRPYSFPTTWLGTAEPAFGVLANPPLLPAYLALVIAIVGEGEIQFHLAFIPIALLAAWGVWRCAACFVRHPGTAAALYLATPAFVISSHTLMPDVGLMALTTHAVASFISGLRERRSGPVALGGALAGLACLAKYNGLILFPLFAFAWWLYRRGNAYRLAWLLLPLGIVGAWSLHNIVVYGQPHILAATALQTSPLPWRWHIAKAIGTASYFGAVGLFPLALPVIAWASPGMRTGLLVGVAIAAPLAVMTKGVFLQSVPITMALLLFFTAFFVYLVAVARELHGVSWRTLWQGNGEGTALPFLLVCWLGTALVFNQTLLFTAARYLLPALLPALLLLVRTLEQDRSAYGGLTPLRVTGILTLLLSLGLSVGDMQFADVGRSFVRSFSAQEGSQPPFWFVGRLGFQYYVERGGGRVLAADDTSPRPGDLLIISQNSFPHVFDQSVTRRLIRLKVVDVPSSWLLKTISRQAPAFFHANFITSPRPHVFVPYWVSLEPLDRIALYRVGAPQPDPVPGIR